MYNAPICALLLILATCSGVLGDKYIDSIFVRCYNKSISDYHDVPLNNTSEIFAKIDVNLNTKIAIHGFTQSCNSLSMLTIAEAYLELEFYNVLVIDYREIAALLYTEAVARAEDVGIAIAACIKGLVLLGLTFSNIHVIGFSLGAQVAGYVGVHTDGKLGRITGLDPAGPLFNVVEPCLNASAAIMVDIIHTDSGGYGIARATGTVDFFPNGGHRVQPGCPTLYLPGSSGDSCSHIRAWQVFAESVRYNNNFIGSKCSSEAEFSACFCNNNEKVVMGHALSPNATGNVYLSTSGDINHLGLGEKGAVCGTA